jgi:hypothetical protein
MAAILSAISQKPLGFPAAMIDYPCGGSTMWKWTKRIALLVLVLLVAGGVTLYFTIDGIIRKQVVAQSSKSLNLATHLQAANFQPFQGQLTLTNFAIDNPSGFTQGNLLELGGLQLKVDYGQLRSTPVRVDAIVIDRPRMLLEHKDGRFNVKAVVDQFYGEPTAPTPPAPQPPQPQPQPQPAPQPQPQPSPQPDSADAFRLVIKKIAVTSPVVVLRPGVPLPGLVKDQIEIPIDSFELNNIGTDESATNGTAFKQVMTQLITTMAAKARASDMAKQVLSPELQAALDGDLSQVAGKLLPGDAGQVVSQLVQGNVLKDPNQLKTNALGVAGQQLRNIGGPTTQPLGALGGLAADALDSARRKEEKKNEKRDEKKRDEKKPDEKKPQPPLPLPPP